MITLPLSQQHFSMIGIDPGSTTTGFSIFNVDPKTEEIIQLEGFTLDLGKTQDNQWLVENYGDRYRRLDGLKNKLLDILCSYHPAIISIESPFFNQLRPQAYGVLMEVMAVIKSTIMQYDNWLVPQLIDPSSVKNAVGAGGGAKKEVIREKILELPETLKYLSLIQTLDEHSLDALAVNYARFRRIFSRR